MNDPPTERLTTATAVTSASPRKRKNSAANSAAIPSGQSTNSSRAKPGGGLRAHSRRVYAWSGMAYGPVWKAAGMCRLFGISGGEERVRATFWLLEAPDSLAEQSRREPDGTGLGWFDDDGAPVGGEAAARGVRGRAVRPRGAGARVAVFVAHIRYATTGGVEARNTHPFEQQGRLFAHNGVVGGLERLERELGDDLALVEGETDSERLFALVTRETERHRGDVGAGITAAARWVAEHLPLYAINLVLGTADGLWALRYPDTTSCGCSSAAPAARTATGTSTRRAPPAPSACAPSGSRGIRR